MDKKQPDINYSDLPEDWMSTIEDRLRFAIRFCQEDLNRMRAGDQINLREELSFFMYGAPMSASVATPSGVIAFDEIEISQLSNEELSKLQKEVYEVLNCAASWGKAINPRSVIKPDSPLPRHHISVDLDLRQDLIGVHGSSRDCLLFILYRLLVQEPGTVRRISLCPGCGRIFYKIKRQKYCSQRCSNRMYMQEYRSKNGEETSEANHKQYEKRVKAKLGKTVKVGRRKEKYSAS